MIVQDSPEGKVIFLSKSFDNRSKMLNFCYFILFAVAMTGFFSMQLATRNNGVGIKIFSIVIVVVFLIVSFRFINSALMREKMIVTKDRLTLFQEGFLTQKSFTYDIGLISNFRYLDKSKIAPHPLAGNTFDYLGFDTEQKVINEVYGDKKLAFDYNGLVIRFGENIYSWQFEELEVLLYEITGNDLRYTDKFEKENFSDLPESDN